MQPVRGCESSNLGAGSVSQRDPADGKASRPDAEYTRTWSPSGDLEYLELADGMRVRYLRTGSVEAPLVLLHTVRTQLDHFQFVIPKIVHAFTVFAVDFPRHGLVRTSDRMRGTPSWRSGVPSSTS